MRRPLALSNWKMAMTIGESRAFVAAFLAEAWQLLAPVEVVLCPPYTALHAVAQALRGQPAQLGAQDVSLYEDPAHTGQISAQLLADAGCRWVMLGHWEVRRGLGDDDALVNRKVHRALQAGLRPLPLVGEALGREAQVQADLERQLPAVLAGCSAQQVAQMAFIYEPEWAIGAGRPAPLAHAEAGCRAIRSWVRARYGDETAASVRTIYGGSVSPGYAQELLQAPDVDGLGASRLGRDPHIWAQIVRLVAAAKTGTQVPAEKAR